MNHAVGDIPNGVFRVTGMAHTQGVRVSGAPGSGKLVADGKGVRCEAESEGRRGRNLDPRNTNRIRRVQGGETAEQVEARYLHGARGRKCGGHLRRRGCALPREASRAGRERKGSG